MEIKECINDLLALYKFNIERFLNLFNVKFGITNPVKAWYMGLIEKVGFLDDVGNIEYSMHGAGCTIEFNKMLISFDIDELGNYRFDKFKFLLYVKSVPYFKNKNVIVDYVNNNDIDLR